jgi:hypothetical protein
VPRTTLVLQTNEEPTGNQLEKLLNDLLEGANDAGLSPLKAHGIAPMPTGESLILTVLV